GRVQGRPSGRAGVQDAGSARRPSRRLFRGGAGRLPARPPGAGADDGRPKGGDGAAQGGAALDRLRPRRHRPRATKAYPVYVDDMIEPLDVVSVSVGARGLQVLLAPADYLRATGAWLGPIAAAES